MRITCAGLAVALCLLLITASGLSGCGGNPTTAENTATPTSSLTTGTSNPTLTTETQSTPASSTAAESSTLPAATPPQSSVTATASIPTSTQISPTGSTSSPTQSPSSTTKTVTTITINPVPPSGTTSLTPSTSKPPPSIVATITVDAPQRVEVGSDFTASIKISPVTLFDGTNYSISFDPEVLRLDDVTPGRIDDKEIPVTGFKIIAPGFCNVLQSIPGLTGINGSGTLSVLHFHVLGGQSSQITISNGTIVNTQTEEIGADWVGDSVSVY